MNQLNQEKDQQQIEEENQKLITSPANLQKIELIDHHINTLKIILFISLSFAILRLILFIFINYDPEYFITLESNKKTIDATVFIFFVLTSFIDILSIMNDGQILKFINKQMIFIRQIKDKLRVNSSVIPMTRLGSYQIYLNIQNLIRSCMGTGRTSGSIHDTIKALHVFITFYGAGSFALNSQLHGSTTLFKLIFLWLYILSIYLGNFQNIFRTLEVSTGPFIETLSVSTFSSEITRKRNKQWRQLVQVFVKKVRRPFKIIYIIIIGILMILLMGYCDLRILDAFSWTAFLCVMSHTVELAHQNYIQNKLINKQQAYLPYKFITPYRILSQITKEYPKIFQFITSFNRVAIVLFIMAYFRSDPQSPITTILFITFNCLAFFGQYIKFYQCKNYKLYQLHPYRGEMLPDDKECTICLLDCRVGKGMVELPCFANHIFHIDCMRKWLKQRRQCPLCRYSLEQYQIQ